MDEVVFITTQLLELLLLRQLELNHNTAAVIILPKPETNRATMCNVVSKEMRTYLECVGTVRDEVLDEALDTANGRA